MGGGVEGKEESYCGRISLQSRKNTPYLRYMYVCVYACACTHRYMTFVPGLEMRNYLMNSQVDPRCTGNNSVLYFESSDMENSESIVVFPSSVCMFVSAVDAVKSNKSFKVPTLANKTAVETAGALSLWCMKPENTLTLSTFSHILLVRLKACFTRKYKTLKLRKEKMWGAYHRLRTATTFRKHWASFLNQSISYKAHPAFYQFVTQTIFDDLIKEEFLIIPPSTVSEHPESPLSLEEHNALRYVAGYVCRKVKVDVSKSPDKDRLLQCVMEFFDDETEDVEVCEASELWLNAVDRGGLLHVCNMAYSFFLALEEQIRRFFVINSIKDMGNSSRNKLINNLKEDNDVFFHWCLLIVGHDDDVASIILSKVISLYVTI